MVQVQVHYSVKCTTDKHTVAVIAGNEIQGIQALYASAGTK